MVEAKSFTKDRYGGIEIKDLSLFPESEAEFESSLAVWIADWKTDKVRSVQVFFRAPKFHLMNVAMRHGFFLHHAKSDYVLMILWLDATTPCRMPAYASHYVGIGGCVLRIVQDQTSCELPFEVLMIKENRTTDARKWKFPGGFVDPGEALGPAVVREVREETGVQVEFLSLVNLREQLNFKYGATDFYFTSVCITCSDESPIRVEDTGEVQLAQWIPLDRISENNDDKNPPEFLLYPAPYTTLMTVKPQLQRLVNQKGKDIDRVALKEWLMKENLAASTRIGTGGGLWTYYTPAL